MLSGVQELDQAQLKQLTRFYIRNGKNCIMLGPAGIGKTDIAFQSAEEEVFEYCYLNLSVLEAPDINGLPNIVEEVINGKAFRFSEYAPPRFLPRAGISAKKKVLIVDELDKAREELQNPMLELFQFRSVNGTKFDIQAVVATGNLPDEHAFSRPLSHALTNRCALFKVTHSYDAWRDWATIHAVNPLVVGFLGDNTEQLLMKEAEGDETAYCSRSPRSWTQAAFDLDSAESADVDFQTMLVAGRVGQTGASSFKVWLEYYRELAPHIKNLVQKGDMTLDMRNLDLGQTMVFAIGAVDGIMRASRMPESEVKGREKKKAVQEVTFRVSKLLNTLPSEICVSALKSTLDHKVIDVFGLVEVKGFVDVYRKIRAADKNP
ncbi:MAG TPA: hypothetical protein VIE65_12340 [Methylobacter sp.]|jgi:hypothetical protein